MRGIANNIVTIACACAIASAGLVGASASSDSSAAYAVDTAVVSTGSTVKVSGSYKNKDVKAVFKKVNGKRSKAGSAKLKLDKSLQRAAEKLAAEQAVYYGTTRPNASSWTSALPSRLRRGATLRRCGSYAVTKTQAVKALYKKADSHKKSAGIACFETEGQRYWVMVISSHAATKAKASGGDKEKTVKLSAKTWMLGDIEIEKSDSSPALVYMKNVTLTCRVKNKGAGNGASFVAQNAKFTSSDPKTLRVSGKIARSVGSGPASVFCTVAGKSCEWKTHCYVNVIKGEIWEIADNPEMVGSYKIDSDTGMGLGIPPTQRYAYCRYTSYIEYDGVRTYGKTTDVFKVENDRYTGEK